MTKYPYTLSPQEEGGFTVQFLDFPTGITEGDTLDEARYMAKDMITGLVECYKDDGMALPVASAIGHLDFVEVLT